MDSRAHISFLHDKKSGDKLKQSILELTTDKSLDQLAKSLSFKEYYVDDSDKEFFQRNFYSDTIVQDIIEKILKNSYKIIVDREMDKMIPDKTMNWVTTINETILDVFTIENDSVLQDIELQGIVEDPEPKVLKHDEWNRYCIGVSQMKQKNNNTETLMANSRRSFGLTSGIKSLDISIQDPKFIKTKKQTLNELENFKFTFKPIEETQEEDKMEINLRLAYERDLKLRETKEQLEKIREIDFKSQKNKLQSIANQKEQQNITFDYEGRILIQNNPQYDKLPNSLQKPLFDVSLIEQTTLKEVHKTKQVEKITSINKQSDQQFQQSKFYFQQYQNPEELQLQQGVTFYCQGNAKQGPNSNTNNYRYLSSDEISQNLINPNLSLKLSKQEYQSIIQKTQEMSFKDNKTIKSVSDNNKILTPLDLSKISAVPQVKYGQMKTKIANSSQIRFHSETNSLIDQFLNPNDSIIEQELRQQTMDTTNFKKNNDNLSIFDQTLLGGSNSTLEMNQSHFPRLPIQNKKMQSLALPSLVKFPRERVTKIAKKQHESKYNLTFRISKMSKS